MGFFDSLFSSLTRDTSDSIRCPVCNSSTYWCDDDDRTCWVCSSCGHEVHGDEVEFDESGNASSTEIDWYCDSCDAHLNYQAGFNPYGSTWTCSECGHENDISKDNVWR